MLCQTLFLLYFILKSILCSRPNSCKCIPNTNVIQVCKRKQAQTNITAYNTNPVGPPAPFLQDLLDARAFHLSSQPSSSSGHSWGPLPMKPLEVGTSPQPPLLALSGRKLVFLPSILPCGAPKILSSQIAKIGLVLCCPHYMMAILSPMQKCGEGPWGPLIICVTLTLEHQRWTFRAVMKISPSASGHQHL